MKSLESITLISIVLFLFSTTPSSVKHSTSPIVKREFTKADSLFVFNPKISLKLKRAMQDSAMANGSTAPNFIVILATDQATNQTKEICTVTPFVQGALDRNNLKKSDAIKNNRLCERHYYLNTKKALENIAFNSYNYTDLLRYGQNPLIRRLVANVSKSTTTQDYNFQGTNKEQCMFAHILFNNGIMSTQGCIAGNLMTLNNAKRANL